MTAVDAGASFLEKVRRKLGDERGEIFYSLCQMAKVGPNDPEAALALAVASLYVDARELEPALARTSNALQEAMSKFVTEVPALFQREMGAAATQALDGTVIEVQRMIKELVSQETSAAAVVRTGAIDDEVKKLSGKMEEFANKRAEVLAAQKSASSGSAPAAHAPGATSAALTVATGVACGLCALIGFFMGLRVHHVHF